MNSDLDPKKPGIDFIQWSIDWLILHSRIPSKENIIYAQRLMAAGVSTELHVYPGAYHGFQAFSPDADVSQWCVIDTQRAVNLPKNEKRGLTPKKQVLIISSLNGIDIKFWRW